MAKAHEIFDKYAHWYAEQYMVVNMFAAGLDFFLNHLPPASPKVLDIACGPGNITAYLQQKRPDLQLTGIDRAPTMVEIAKKQVPTAHFAVLDAYDISKLASTFQGTVIGFLLPYLPPDRLDLFFKNVKSQLVPGGLVYISTIEGDPKENGWQTNSKGDQVQVFYYREADFKALLEPLGKILFFEKIDFKKADGTLEINLIAVLQFQNK